LLGEHDVSDFLRPGTPVGGKAPLKMVLCRRCCLPQLKHTVSPENMYRNHWCRSGTNQTMRTAPADIANTAEQLIHLRAGDLDGFQARKKDYLLAGGRFIVPMPRFCLI
jgi:hypothetical protein